MSTENDGTRRVRNALEASVGDRAKALMHKRSKHLANLTPHEVALAPSGVRVVLAELDNIILQAYKTKD